MTELPRGPSEEPLVRRAPRVKLAAVGQAALNRVVRGVVDAVLDFTSQQRAVIESSAQDRLLVVASAGTGKTATLVARLEHLAADTGLSPASELLVLTFSRAAAGELQRRLRRSAGEAAYAKVSTFDSFATRILALHAEEEGWEAEDYDGRIEAATALIQSRVDARNHLAAHQHLIVDEVQDLVGVRARFVLALIESIGGGYTLAGDPAQSIYDFQLDGSGDGFDSVAFLDALRKLPEKAPTTIHLGENFRALSEEARSALAVGVQLAESRANYDSARTDLLTVVDGLDEVRPDFLPTFLARSVVPTGVLTRFNGQALALSHHLHNGAVSHRLQSAATDRAIAPWIGALLADVDSAHLTQSKLERLIDESPSATTPEPDEAWSQLRRAVGAVQRAIPLRELNQRLSRGQVPDELHWVPEGNVVISTVHRAKGLEFDNVIVIDPEGWLEDDANDEETRILYVALTRARRSLRVFQQPGFYRLKCRGNPGERWVWHGREAWQRFGIELRPSDVEFRYPPSGSPYGLGSAVQEYLRDQVGPGDPVVLHRFTHETPDGPRTRYRIFHDGMPIGETTEEFGGHLFLILRSARRGRHVRFPSAIEDLVLGGIDTCAGPAAVAEQAGLGRAGFWLRPRLSGLGRFHWD